MPKGGNSDGKHHGNGGCRYYVSRVMSWCFDNFLPIALVLFTIFGALYPDPGRYMNDDTPLNIICIVLIFLITGIKLKTAEIKNAIGAWRGWLFGSISILFITPLLALALIHLPLAADISFGFALLACMPTTISSGVMLVKEARGNAPLALLMCLITNILCIFTIPFLFPVLLNTGTTEVKIDAAKLLMNLSLTILVPLIVGKILHDSFEPLRRFSRRRRVEAFTKFFTTILLTVMPWMNISVSVDKLSELSVGVLFQCIAWMFAMHIVYLIFHVLLLCVLPLRHNGQATKAITIMAAQKSPTILFSVLAFLPDTLGSKGLIAIPAILCQLVQILMDSVLVAKWAHYQIDPEQEEAAREWKDTAPRLSPRGSRRESIDLDDNGTSPFGGRRRSFDDDDEEDDDTKSASGSGRAHLPVPAAVAASSSGTSSSNGRGTRSSSRASTTSHGPNSGVFTKNTGNAFTRLGDDDDDDDDDNDDDSRTEPISPPRGILIDKTGISSSSVDNGNSNGSGSVPQSPLTTIILSPVRVSQPSASISSPSPDRDDDNESMTTRLTAPSAMAHDATMSKNGYRTFNDD